MFKFMEYKGCKIYKRDKQSYYWERTTDFNSSKLEEMNGEGTLGECVDQIDDNMEENI